MFEYGPVRPYDVTPRRRLLKMINPTRRGLAPHGLVERPLDFYVAFLVFFMGMYGFLDPTWPEKYERWIYWVLTIEDIYLVTSGGIIMTALILKELGKWVVGATIMEMFGWLFISAAAAVITLTAFWLPVSAIELSNPALNAAWILLWGGLSVSAGTRYLYMRWLSKGAAQ